MRTSYLSFSYDPYLKYLSIAISTCGCYNNISSLLNMITNTQVGGWLYVKYCYARSFFWQNNNILQMLKYL